MRPLDPRLLRRIGSARRWVLLAVSLQVGVAVLVVVQAFLLASAVAGVVQDGLPASSVLDEATLLVVVVALRAAIAGAQERFGHRAATDVVAELRVAVLAHAAAAGPAAADDPGATATLLTRGLDALDGYLVRYLPQLIATAVLTPALIVVLLSQDLISAVVVTITLPLVPVLMALVGWTTQRLSAERLRRMQQLGAQLLDLVAGLPTLRALGRARQQAHRVREVGEAYRSSTTAVLRQAFLSGMVLELVTTLSVAVVAVGVGLRLLGGGLDLRTALVVLVLAPEAYLPLRLVGQHFHASTDGLAALTRAIRLLESPVRPYGSRACPVVHEIRWDGVGVERPGRRVVAPAGLRGRAVAGSVTALVGANGSGKSTAVAVALGLLVPTTGRVLLVGPDGAEHEVGGVDRAAWHRQVAWTPQRPALVPGTLADNLRLAVPAASWDDLGTAAARAGLDEVVARLPDGWRTRLGAGGHGLSAGERQRVGLARTLLRVGAGAHVVVLDEPTAHLDEGTEQVVLRTVRQLADDGCLVVVVAHRPSLRDVADAAVTVRSLAAAEVAA